MMKKSLILIRHAHRETSNRTFDNGLSEKGLKQSRYLGQFAQARWSKGEVKDLKAQLLSSPKRRCLETLAPLSDLWGVPIQVRSELDELSPEKDFSDLQDRASKFMDWWVKKGPHFVVACSHGDWLPLALHYLVGFEIEMKKGALVELEWDGGRAKLLWLVPTFKPFYDG